MPDKKSVGHAYNVDFLNIVFAASSLFLFATSIWLIWDDFDREWKGYQRRFIALESEVTQLDLAEAQSAVDQELLAALSSERANAEQELASNQEQVEELERLLGRVEADLFVANQRYLYIQLFSSNFRTIF